MTAAKEFVISRVFDAPRDLVWRCFTDPERMKQWWGPQGLHRHRTRRWICASAALTTTA